MHKRATLVTSLGLLMSLLWSAGGDGALAAPPRTWSFLTTGNGHGFQLYDASSNRITTFLEHPYRYLRPRADPRSDGIGRRDLAYDFFFGVKGNGAAGWLSDGTSAGDPGYVEETNIIRAPMKLGGQSVETYYFSPFGFEGNAMVALLKAPGAQEGYALFNFHMGNPGGNPDEPGADSESLRALGTDALSETGPGGGALVYLSLGNPDKIDCDGVFNKVKGGGGLGQRTDCSGFDTVPAFQRAIGADGWMGVVVGFTEQAGDADALAQRLRTWAAGRAPEKILNDAKAEFEAWRKPIPAAVMPSEDERRIWRQGEAVLRMGQVREAFLETRRNNGMILASLPKGEWHSGWVRDAMYAVVALARSGHHAETKLALDFFLNASPVGKFKSYVRNADYRISVVRYFGSGEEEADYSGQPSPNVEIDGWGMMLWAARQYVDASGDAAWLSSKTRKGEEVYGVLSKEVAEALEKNLESNGIAKADSSIWEVHDDNKKHFAYTTLSAFRGFCDMATLAQRAGRAADVTRYQELARKVRTGFFASFLDQKGAIAGSQEELQTNLYKDGAVVEAFTWGMLDNPADRVGLATLDLLEQLRVSSGGYKRNDDGLSSYDNNEWILIDLRMSDALRRAGKGAAADGVLRQVVEKAAVNFNLLPELYNAVAAEGSIGKYTGSVPMVGYGGGAFILTLLDRAGLYEPSDCGFSQLTDMGVQATDMMLGGGPGPGPGPGSMVPYSSACPCNIGGAGPAAGQGALVLLLAPLLALLRRRGRR